MFNFKILKFNRKGQGMIEVMIAIYLVIVGLLSLMNLVFYNLRAQSFNHNMLISSNLAREGIEVVRNIRDSNWLNSDTDWDENLIFIPPGNLGSLSDQRNSFVIYNSFFHGEDLKFSIMPVGLSWENCTNSNNTFQGEKFAVCKLNIIKDSVSDIKFYDHFSINFEDDLIENTNFYRLIYINEICFNELNGRENIADGYNEKCSDYGLNKIGTQVISRVGWEVQGSIKELKIEEHLYDWK